MNIFRNSLDLNYITSIKNHVFSYVKDHQHKILMIAVACLSLFSLVYLYRRYNSKSLSTKLITQQNSVITPPPVVNVTRVDVDCEEEESPSPPLEMVMKPEGKKSEPSGEDLMLQEPPPAPPDDPGQNLVTDTTSDDEQEEDVNNTPADDGQADQTTTTLQTKHTNLQQEDINAKTTDSPKTDERDSKASHKIIASRTPARIAPRTPKINRRSYSSHDNNFPTPGTLLASTRAKIEKLRPSIAGRDDSDIEGVDEAEWDE